MTKCALCPGEAWVAVTFIGPKDRDDAMPVCRNDYGAQYKVWERRTVSEPNLKFQVTDA